ncbi:MAG: 1-acyl-sn-glycerol-3-phosphate acyltransferase, partial [Hyphomicrobiales bacterium]
MIQRLIYDAQVIEAAGAWAKAKGVPENVGFETARRYAREIVPRFSATAYFGFAIRLARLIAQSFYKVRTSSADEDALSGIDPDATVIFVMNHRSNMDYVLVTYLAAERSALSYAVGEWARIWPLTSLIKAMGAYFIRRKNSNDLYRTVLERYVQLATKGGVTQAVFPEGKLSLTGHTAPAKLGILNYIIKDFDPQASGDVVFVPVSLNYDRVLEDRFLLEATQSG